MGTNKIKFILFIAFILIMNRIFFAQAEYVPYDHSIYNFLERMDANHIISDYNSLEKPKTRKQISNYLNQILENIDLLSSVDKNIFEDYKNEFEYELSGTLLNSESLIGIGSFDFISQREKYFYSFIKSGKGTLFINLTGQINNINDNNRNSKLNYNATYVKYGGQIRGTILDKFGYYIKGTNGKVYGDKSAAENLNEIKFSYKYNIDPNLHTATDYIDNTEGYLNTDLDLVRFKIGRDRKQIGYGPLNYILSDNSPYFDYLSFDLDFQPLTFSYFHGKLLGSLTSRTDSIEGGIRTITDKYIGYHRIGINFSRDFSLGFGEMIIYSNRSLDFSYLNPFNFYKSVEHANNDRDNSLLFIDLMNNSVKGLKLFGSVLIDDIDFSKIGTGWYGNEMLYNFTLYSSNLYKILPIDFYLQYIRCEPYVYTHRIYNNNYTNLVYSLAAPIQPNSDIFITKFICTPYHRLNLELEFSFSRHGANLLNQDGTIKKNVGGDILIGHRDMDETKVSFLDGDREYFRSISFNTVYQPIKDYYIIGNIIYKNNSLQNNLFQNYLTTFIVVDLRI
jgi:hypothetical protein